MRKFFVVALVVIAFVTGAVAVGALDAPNPNTGGVILFVGDSNLTLGAGHAEITLTRRHMDNGYVSVFAPRIGASIRTPDCADEANCDTWDYWKLKLAG